MGPAIRPPPLSRGGDKGYSKYGSIAVSLSGLYHCAVVEVYERWRSLSEAQSLKAGHQTSTTLTCRYPRLGQPGPLDPRPGVAATLALPATPAGRATTMCSLLA